MPPYTSATLSGSRATCARTGRACRAPGLHRGVVPLPNDLVGFGLANRGRSRSAAGITSRATAVAPVDRQPADRHPLEQVRIEGNRPAQACAEIGHRNRQRELRYRHLHRNGSMRRPAGRARTRRRGHGLKGEEDLKERLCDWSRSAAALDQLVEGQVLVRVSPEPSLAPVPAAPKGAASPRRARSTRVLAKNPISPPSPRGRLAIGEPTGTSSWPRSAQEKLNPASTTMNRLAPRCGPSLAGSRSNQPMTNSWLPPRNRAEP